MQHTQPLSDAGKRAVHLGGQRTQIFPRVAQNEYLSTQHRFYIAPDDGAKLVITSQTGVDQAA